MEQFIKNLVKGAGAIVRKGYATKMKISRKSGPWDLLTKYDLAADNFIVQKIRRRFPSHGILSEESGQAGSNKNFWIIDPIDGTTAFTRGIPQFAVCIAFVHLGKITEAAVYNPIADELFYASVGRGATLNGKKIRVADKPELDHAWFAQHNSRDFSQRPMLLEGSIVPMRTGSMQLSGSYTAAGRYDILISKGLNPWDYAACALIIKEAGGKVTTLEGKPYHWNSDSILAANPKLHRKILKQLRKS